jgi:hypothetical protein
VGILGLLMCLVAGCGSSGEPVPAQIPTTNQALLISWDGAQRAHVREMLAAGRLPHLQRLIRQGGFAETQVRGHATETLTGHTEILTGYRPSDLGVYRVDDFRVIPHDLTVFVRLETHFAAEGFTTVWVSGKADRMRAGPGEVWSDTKAHVDVWEGDVNRGNEVTGPLAVSLLEAHAAPGAGFFAFVHFKEPDSVGHRFGENSPEYDAGLIAVDAWLGRMRRTLDEQGVGATTAVFVTTDHGFNEGGLRHKRAPDAWLATNWAPLRDGAQWDVAPTVLWACGVDWRDYLPPFPGRPLWTEAR